MIGSIGVRCCGILLCSYLVGCVGGGAPSARVVDASVEQVAGGSSVVAFVVEARTPTKEAIPMPRIRYELRSAGRVLFRGVRSPEATIPPEGSITFRLPVPLEEPPHGLAYELVGEIRYIAPGALAEAFYDNGLSRPSMALRDRGVIDLDDTP